MAKGRREKHTLAVVQKANTFLVAGVGVPSLALSKEARFVRGWMLGGRGAAAGVLGLEPEADAGASPTAAAMRPTDADLALVLSVETEGGGRRTEAWECARLIAGCAPARTDA